MKFYREVVFCLGFCCLFLPRLAASCGMFAASCCWRGKIMVRVFCGGIRCEAGGCVGFGCVWGVRCWFSWDIGVWVEGVFRTKLLFGAAIWRQFDLLTKYKKSGCWLFGGLVF